MSISANEYIAIALRVNSIIMYAENGNREAVAEGYTKLLKLMTDAR